MVNLESTECLFCNPGNGEKMKKAVHLGKSKELAQLIRDIDQISPDEVQRRLDAMVSGTRENLESNADSTDNLPS